MIFVSSSCVSREFINESVEKLARDGYKNIELSGGTRFYENYLEDLLELQAKFSLNYRCHNYFPPPTKSFVLNFASNRNDVITASRKLAKEAIRISKVLGAKVYGVHAGFKISPNTNELGKSISNRNGLIPHKAALDQFLSEINAIDSEASQCGIKLYIENCVVSQSNYESFEKQNPFLLTSWRDFEEMRELSNFNLLLDVGHLKVSANVLNNNFEEELNQMIGHSDYLHISDNNGRSDSNEKLSRGTVIHKALQENELKGKSFTIEVYNDPAGIEESIKIIEDSI